MQMLFNYDKYLSYKKIDEIGNKMLEVLQAELSNDYFTTEITTAILKETIDKIESLPLIFRKGE